MRNSRRTSGAGGWTSTIRQVTCHIILIVSILPISRRASANAKKKSDSPNTYFYVCQRNYLVSGLRVIKSSQLRQVGAPALYLQLNFRWRWTATCSWYQISQIPRRLCYQEGGGGGGGGTLTLKEGRVNRGTPSSSFPETRPMERGLQDMQPTPGKTQHSGQEWIFSFRSSQRPKRSVFTF